MTILSVLCYCAFYIVNDLSYAHTSDTSRKIVCLVESLDTLQYDRSLFVNASVAESDQDLTCEIIPLPKGTQVDQLCELLSADVDFVISLVEDIYITKNILTMAKQSRVPTIQVEYGSWIYQENSVESFAGLTINGSNAFGNDSATIDVLDMGENLGLQNVLGTAFDFVVTKLGHAQAAEDQRKKIEEENYIRVLLPRTSFLNVLGDYKESTDKNVTKLPVIYDLSYDMSDSVWQDVLEASGFQLEFIAMEVMNRSEMLMQVQEIIRDPELHTLLIIGLTPMIEAYFAATSEVHMDSDIKWFVITMDVRPFECADCANVNALWIRPDEGGEFRKIRLFKKFLRESFSSQDMVNGANEVDVSFLHDLVGIGIEFTNRLNGTYIPEWAYGCANTTDPISHSFENGTITKQGSLRELMSEQPSGGYGSFLPDPIYRGVYFQNIEGRLIQIAFAHDKGKSTNEKSTVGNWTLLNGIQQIYSSLDVDLTEIKRYTIVTLTQAPFIERCVPSPCEDGLPFKGYCIDLIKMLQKEIGFEYDIYEVKDKSPGTLNDQQEWNGLIGDLVSSRAQIALAPLTVMAERENAVDFTVPFYDLVGTSVIMKTPEDDYNLFKFLTVLEIPVWICIAAAYFFTSILLWIFDKFSPYSYSNNRDAYVDDPEKREFDFKECLWFCITSLTPQGGGEAPKNISGRIVAATWWLFGFIIIASYTANLAALLTVSRLETEIESLDDLALQYKIRYAPVKGTASETYFKRMAEIEEAFYDLWKKISLNDAKGEVNDQLAVWDYPVSDKFTNLWRAMQDAGLPNSTDQAIQRVLASNSATDGFAFIGDATEIRYAALTNCQLRQVGDEFSRKPYAIAVQQGSKLKEIFSSAILKLLNERELEKLKTKWWDQNPNARECPTMLDESNGISIQNIGGVFIMVLVGIGLSITTLVFEYWYNKDKHLEENENETQDSNIIRTKPTFSWQAASRQRSTESRDRSSSFLGIDIPSLRRRSTQKSSNFCKHCKHCNTSPAHSPNSANGLSSIYGSINNNIDLDLYHMHF